MSEGPVAEHSIAVTRAKFAQDFAVARELFMEYATGLDIDLAYQGFQTELGTLQDHYGRPDTCLLIARDWQGTCGCVGVRRFDVQNCEMKRLYVRPRVRGAGLGRLLAAQAIAFATECQYQSMLLDSLPTMAQAVSLYKSLGFKDVPPYYSSPVVGTLYMKLHLDPLALRLR